MLKKLNAISAWGIFLIGFIHISGLFWFFVYLVEPGTVGVAREPVPWWAVGGITLWLGGGLNILRLRYRNESPGILPIALAANVVMVAFEIWLEVNNPGFLTPLRMLLLVFQVLATLFTIAELRQARRTAPAAAAPGTPGSETVKLDPLFAWLILLLGIAHILSTFYVFQPLAEPGTKEAAREPALWYFSGGVSLCMCAGLNSIRIRYGRKLEPLAWVSLLATLIMLYHLFLVLTVQVPLGPISLKSIPTFLLILRGPLLVVLSGALWANLRFVRSTR